MLAWAFCDIVMWYVTLPVNGPKYKKEIIPALFEDFLQK